MNEFFTNIGKWFIENKDAIVIYLSSGQFIAFSTMIYKFVKSIKSMRDNTKSTNDLNLSIKENGKLLNTTKSIKDNTDEIAEIQKQIQNNFAKMYAKIEESLELQTNKINTVIEVQSIVYSTIKDERVRNTVNNLLTNAKYAETSTRAELYKQIEELKATVASQVKQITESVAEKVDQVEAIVNPDTDDVINAAKADVYLRG